MRLGVRDVRVLLIAVAATTAIAFPLGVLASHQFADVPDSNTFHNDISAIADAGVTTGCGGGNYCPKEYVTREQMAAFLNRLGALAAGKTPVVNAAKVDGHDNVLAAEDIVVNQMGPWLAGQSGSPTIEHQVTGTAFIALAGAREVLLPLQAPGSIGGTTYGIKSVRICHDSAANVTITSTRVAETEDTGSAGFVIDDGTDRALSSSECYTVADLTPQAQAGGLYLYLSLSYAADTGAFFGNVRSTWTPVS